nr:unnamed protein product [Callosobruchus analis]CAI5846541.1 unnamed protein product [Callosobruchus analis]
MEWHAEASISEGSVMLSIPETDDDNIIAVKKRKTSRAPTSSAQTPVKTTNTFGVLTNTRKELIDSKTPNHTYTKEEDKVKRIVMKAVPNMDLDDIKEDLLKKNIVLTNCTPLVGRGNNSYSYLLSLHKNV